MNAAQDPATLDLLAELSDALVADLDVDGLLERITHRCIELLDAQAAGVMLADDRGVLRLLAAAPEFTTWIDLVESAPAPATWSFATGLPVTDADLDIPDPRWAAFARQAREGGFRSVAALPMRIRGEVIGVLSLLRHRAGWLTPEQLSLAQSLANVATAGLLTQHDQGYRAVLAAQSQRVLSGRVAVERARGILAELLDIGVDTALDELRRHASRTGQGLSAAADQVVASVPLARELAAGPPMLLVHRITVDTLPELRALVRQRIADAGLSGSAADAFLLAVHEAAANAEEYAVGGRLWLWHHRGSVWCEVSDDGPGLPVDYRDRTDSPRPGDMRHAGLWLIRRICPDSEITSTPQGTRLLLRQPLPGHPGTPFTPGDAGG
ncbi:GAF domain-containing protein [Actinoplanes oblitus]|uniref:GAF domain-containing protein n=1 Tax=Actinoplanes oblitus TaxID=3040509 RepID=A0ABY8W820_9ACTN|nr:GAF domain-containing protein [Actinoplanes oblitus]WIM92563.1 GAF domain-containing protein [Actinoplanes oblitus]